MAFLIKLPILLPTLCFLALWYLFALRSDWRISVFKTSVCMAAAAVAVNEILSLFNALTRLNLIAFWAAILLALALLLLRSGDPRRVLRARLEEIRSWHPARSEKILVAAVLLLVAFAGLTAALSPPNTFDAMVYHLPRIIYWIEHQNVDLFPTNELKQLHMAPGAEFLLLHVHLLWGSDRLVNLLQWAAMAGCLLGVWLIARKLGVGRLGAWLAVIFCLTILQGIIQATGPKNDYVLTFWLVAMICLAAEFGDRPSFSSAILIALAVGLACLTKPTAFLIAPVLLFAMLLVWPSAARRAFARYVAVAFLAALLLNLGHFGRNYRLHGSPFGPTSEKPNGEFKYINNHFTLRTLLENLTRNLAMNASTPSTAVNLRIEKSVRWFLGGLGGDADDPATTFTASVFRVPGLNQHEDWATNPLHVFIACLAFAILLFGRSRRKDRLAYAGAVCVGVVLFCLIFRWQATNARLQLPFLVLSAPVVGLILENLRVRFLAAGLAGILFVSAAATLFINDLRGWTGPYGITSAERHVRYFSGHRDFRESYLKAAELTARQPGRLDIGLDTSIERYEYPLIAALGCGVGEITVRHVGVVNQSRRFDRPTGKAPDVVICLGCARSREKWNSYTAGGAVGTVIGDLVVFGNRLRLKDGEQAYTSLEDLEAEERLTAEIENYGRMADSWVGPVFKDRMYLHDQARSILFRGQIFPKEVNGSLSLEIAVDRTKVGSVTVTKTQVDQMYRAVGLTATPEENAGPYSFFVALPAQVQPGRHLFEIRTPAWFTGQDKYRNGDLRRLSYRLYDWDSRDAAPAVYMRFADGWYSPEASGSSWRRWSSGRGELEIASSEETELVLSGSAASISPENKLEIELNGSKVGELVLDGENRTVGIPGTSIKLRKGRNVLTFSASKRASVANDPRQLSFSILNLTLKSARDGKNRSYLVD